VHILKDGVLVTHPADQYILPGIARRHLIMACRALGIPVEEKAFTMQELMDAEEVIVTSASCFCAVASHMDDAEIGGRAAETIDALQAVLLAEFANA
jgi:D-alanine transaminase